MSINPLPNSANLHSHSSPSSTPQNSSLRQPLSRRFFRNNKGWFVNDDSGAHGPYADKAEAQTALMYYSLRTNWPNEKQLREFVRLGK